MKKLSSLFFLFLVISIHAEVPSVNTQGDSEFTEKEKIAIERGNTIIEALKNYYADNGYYPIELKDLVPKYLKHIPRTGLSDIPFHFDVPFSYSPGAIKYRAGCFSIRFLNYDDRKYYYYFSRSNSFEKDKVVNLCDGPKVLDKVCFEDIKKIVDAVNEYYSVHNEFPENLEILIPNYLKEMPVPLKIRYSFLDTTVETSINYYYQQPLKDDESELPQSFFIRFRYNFDEEYNYHSARLYGNIEWKYNYH